MRILNRFRNGFVGMLVLVSILSLPGLAQAHHVPTSSGGTATNLGGNSNNGGNNNTGDNNNGGNNNQGSGTHSVPEAPYAAVFPLAAIGAAFWVYKKRQHV